MRFEKSPFFEVILYKNNKEVWRRSRKYGKEIRSSGKPVVKVLNTGESIVFCVDDPIIIDSAKCEYEFYINDESWKDKEHLRGTVNVKE